MYIIRPITPCKITNHLNEITEYTDKVILDKIIEANLSLFGRFQIWNLAASIGLAHALGIDVHTINFNLIESVRGRMERVTNAKNLKIFAGAGEKNKSVLRSCFRAAPKMEKIKIEKDYS